MKRDPELRVVDGGKSLPPQWTMPEGLADLAISGDELLARARAPIDFIVQGLIERMDVFMLSGAEKLGYKTYLLIDLCIARSLGAHWLGMQVAEGRPGKALFISAETSTAQFGRRVEHLCKGRGVSAEKVARDIVVISQPITLIPASVTDRIFEEALHRTLLSSEKIPDKDRRKMLREQADLIATAEINRLGRNLAALRAIEEAPPGTFSMIFFDTVRACMRGDDNNSADAANFTQAARDLARTAECTIGLIHHTSKHGQPGSTRAARGSVELTAGPDALLTIDTGEGYQTIHFALRNHEEPQPIGFRLVRSNDGLRFETCEPQAPRGRGRPPAGVDDDEVLAVLDGAYPEALTLSKIRQLVQSGRGGALGSRSNQAATERALQSLLKRGLAEEKRIEPRGHAPFDGFRAVKKGGGPK